MNNSMLRFCPEKNENGQRIALGLCGDVTTCVLNDIDLDAQGHVLVFETKVRNVCPGKRVAVAIALHELDGDGVEYPRGMKTLTLPAHHEQYNCDIAIQNIRFILPGDISVNTQDSDSCTQRQFVARTHAHYVDAYGGDGEV